MSPDLAKKRELLATLRALTDAHRNAEHPAAIPLEGFLTGNNDDNSFARNRGAPISVWATTLRSLAARPDVAGVFVAITDGMDEDDRAWLSSETLYLLTSARSDAIAEGFEETLAPDDHWPLDADEEVPGVPPAPKGMRTVCLCWE